MTLTHRCPGPGTVHSQGGVIPVDRLACSRHWYQVPKPLRNKVYAAWRDGDGAGSQEHQDACAWAIEAMSELQPARRR